MIFFLFMLDKAQLAEFVQLKKENVSLKQSLNKFMSYIKIHWISIKISKRICKRSTEKKTDNEATISYKMESM